MQAIIQIQSAQPISIVGETTTCAKLYMCRTDQPAIKRNDLRTFATDIGITKAGVEHTLTANA
jgi:hypothetical protein